jgi:hydroxymethylbilane synthase
VRGLRIGTRGSALAMWQAEHVAARIREIPGAPAVELVHIETEGDRIQDVALSRLPGKAFFTKELEQTILSGRVDLAVHSLKDVETVMPDGLTLGAILEREDPRDALVARPGLDLATLPEGARVGTSSLRRGAFLRRWRSDLKITDLRGNVPTRVRRLDDGDYDAVVLAAAGLKRLGLEDRITDFLPFRVLLPAVSQGAIGIQHREGDEAVARWVRPLDHEPTRQATTAERALLREVEGGCQVPLGAHATLEDGRLRLAAAVATLDGRASVEGERVGAPGDAAGLGRELGVELLEGGARRIMAGIRAGLERSGGAG